jgi:outer membrane protein
MRLVMLLSLFLLADQASADHPGQGAEKLSDLIQEALASSPEIQAEMELLNAANDREKGARSALAPSIAAVAGRKIDGGGDKSPFAGSNFSQLDATWNLYRGGADRYKKNVASTEVEIAFRELELKRIELAESVAQTFTEMQNNSEALNLIEKMISDARSGKEAARRRFSTGQTTAVDTLEFDILENSLKSQRAAYQAEEVSLAQKMRSLLGRGESRTVKAEGHLAHSTWQINREDLVATALSKNQELMIAILNAQRAKLELDISNSKFLPLVDAKGSWGKLSNRPFTDKRPAWSAEMRVTVPLFSGLSSVNERSAKIHEKSANEFEILNVKRTLQTEIYSLVSRLKSLEQRQILEEKSSDQADKYLQLTNSEYRRGIKNSADVSAALALVLSVQLRNLEFRKDWSLTKIKLQSLTGSIPSP